MRERIRREIGLIELETGINTELNLEKGNDLEMHELAGDTVRNR